MIERLAVLSAGDEIRLSDLPDLQREKANGARLKRYIPAPSADQKGTRCPGIPCFSI
jgi:hypothetical protein